MRTSLHFAVACSAMLPCLKSIAQIPLEPIWGVHCMPDEQYYRDAVEDNSYFPPDQLTVDIQDLGIRICRPGGLDSADVTGTVLPFFHPITTEFLEDVELVPMFYDIERRVTFRNEATDLEFVVDQTILAVELLPYSDDPLAQPYVYLGTNTTIDYNAIRTAIQTHAGEAYDFHDACGNVFQIDNLNVDGLPAIIDTYPWNGGGSRAVLYWRLNGPDGVEWYIQHVMLNAEPYIYPCVPPSTDSVQVSGCEVDLTPPTIDIEPLFLYCEFPGSVETPLVFDDYDSQPSVEFLGEELFGDQCYQFMNRNFRAVDGCGNESFVSQQIDINFTNFLSFQNLPSDAEVAADGLLPTADDIPLITSCLPGESFTIPPTYSGNSVTIELSGFAPCAQSFPEHTFTLTATSVEFHSTLTEELNVTVSQGIPPPVDLATANANNPYYDFELTADTTYSSPSGGGEACEVYRITRTYRTFNGDGDELEDLSFTQSIIVLDADPPIIDMPGNLEVPDPSAVPPFIYAALDDHGLETVVTNEETVLFACEVNYTLLRTVSATDSCGQTTVASQEVRVNGDCSTVGVFEHAGSGPVIFPNPTSGMVTIHATHLPCSLHIRDMSGRVVMTGQLTDPSTNMDMRETLPTGCYDLHLSHQQQVWQQRLVVLPDR